MTFFSSEEFYYSENGEWVQVDENLAAIGLTDLCLHKLGEVLFLDLPEEGRFIRQGEPFFSIESATQIHDFICPVSGTIVEVNNFLLDNPDRMNDDPFNDGWIIRVEMDNEKDLATLMRSPEYKKQVIQRGSLKKAEISETPVKLENLDEQI